MGGTEIRRQRLIGLAAVVALAAAACGSDDASSSTSAPADETTVTVETTEGEQPEPTEEDFEDFDAAVFDEPTVVDNKYMPLVPGTQHVYEGAAIEDDELIERMVISVVTDLTKEINGVETVVFWERDFNDGVLVESEIAFFAQDNDGNVWHFGQYTEVYDEDEFVGGRIWLVDLPEGSRAGIVMQADPQANGESYSQGYAPPPFNWTDRATVGEIGAETCLDDAEEECFEDVLITEESDAESPGAFQLKYYAPGVGNVQVGFRGPDPEEEEMVLVEDIVLEGAELAAAREEALALEERGYLYAQTTPAVPRS